MCLLETPKTQSLLFFLRGDVRLKAGGKPRRGRLGKGWFSPWRREGAWAQGVDPGHKTAAKPRVNMVKSQVVIEIWPALEKVR